MFTGIIEATGTILKITRNGTNIDYLIKSPITRELKIDQSVAHNGVCLTVVEITGDTYCVTAVQETLTKTDLFSWKTGDTINLERSLKIGDRLDGHFVQGHVDAVAECSYKEIREGSWVFCFKYPQRFASLIIEKGSVCLNGVSLTVFDITNNGFSVTIIPYTFSHTNFQFLEPGKAVNIEFDVLGKYLLRSMQVAG